MCLASIYLIYNRIQQLVDPSLHRARERSRERRRAEVDPDGDRLSLLPRASGVQGGDSLGQVGLEIQQLRFMIDMIYIIYINSIYIYSIHIYS